MVRADWRSAESEVVALFQPFVESGFSFISHSHLLSGQGMEC
jgi:hypothetical protein